MLKCYDEVNGMNENIIVRSATETAEVMKVKQSTLRKYCIELENAGYKFSKSPRGHRSFIPDDITIIQRMIASKNHPNITLSQAANSVVSMYQQEDKTITDTEGLTETTPNDDTNSVMTQEQMQEFMNNQQQFNKELLERLDKQQEYIDKRLERRDQELMQGIREMQEEKKQLAATKEKEEEKKGLFSKLFKR